MEVRFFINNKEVVGERGESILTVARREGFYIPTMCYLPKVTPIASCRLCIVEVEGNNGFVLSCQTGIKKGIKVYTDSAALFRERQNIMKLYGVNHPLECGVCDKSGECDLQNRTVEFKVEEQSFAAKEQRRPIEDWGNVQYDPSLCILCEKCVSVSSEIVGDGNLRISYGGYRSKITRADVTKPVSLESVAVCPVGALVDKDFKYTTNAWELKKIPSSCVHCSGACSLNYEVKHVGIETEDKNRIYRVSNEESFVSLCEMGRKDFPKESIEKRDPNALSKCVEAFKNCDTVRFTSSITNEEALILQNLKERLGFKLVNNEAKAYKDFLNTYESSVGETLYSGSVEDINSSDFIITLGTSVSNEHPQLSYALNQASKVRGAKIVYCHPMEEAKLKTAITQSVKYETGSEEGVISMLADALIDKEKLDESLKSYFSGLDIGYISSESNFGEEECEEISKKFEKSENPVIVVGKDLYTHPCSENIAKFLALFGIYGGFKVIISPSELNTLGVSLICDLDEESEGKSVGYKCDGDFTLSETTADENSMLVPTLFSQEGTVTNIDKSVVALNVATQSNNYSLAEVANALGEHIELTTDLTEELPLEKGYKKVPFGKIEDKFGLDGTLKRGYKLTSNQLQTREFSIRSISEIEEYNGSLVYIVKSFSQKRVEKSSADFFVSQQFLNAFKISDGDKVEFSIEGTPLSSTVALDDSLKGTIGYLETKKMETFKHRLAYGYPFVQIQIEKREVE